MQDELFETEKSPKNTKNTKTPLKSFEEMFIPRASHRSLE